MGGDSPPTSFRRAKMVIKCTSAGQSIGQRTAGELLLLKKDKRKSHRATYDTPLQKNLVKLRPWTLSLDRFVLVLSINSRVWDVIPYMSVKRADTFSLEFVSIFSQTKIHTLKTIYKAPKLIKILVMTVVLK